jgi:voltage-gated sodium channel
MGAHGWKFWRYFFDSWNVFDFLIVMVCFLPLNTQHIVVLRLLRLLRVLKLVRALPRLQVLVGAMFKSISSIIYVSILLFLLFYLYGVAGTFIFGNNDPVHFRNLQTSILSLFRACTLEDWTDLMYINMYGSDVYGYDATMLAKWKPQSKAMPVLGAIYFVSFVMIATMILLNLFVGVIINSMDEAMKDAKDAELIQLRGKNTLQEEIAELSRQMEALHNQMERILRKVKKDASL